VEAWEHLAEKRDSDERESALLEAGAAADILMWRHNAIAELEATGVLTLDAHPKDLTASLVSDYLLIKARQML
jgi:hypothetical protein